MANTNPQHTVILRTTKTPADLAIAVSLPERINGNPAGVAAWVATLFKSKKVTRRNEPYMGYKPGRLFDPGALRMGYATRQGKPWYNVIGPGAQVFGQLAVAEPAGFLSQQQVQVLPTTGNGGQLAGSYPSQGLSLPPPTALGEPSSRSL